MSSLEKRHTGQRGSMQGHRKYSDGFSDTSSSGSCMDDTDREVSNLTDRAFRSLCIGEEAIYNDSEFSSSPTERHKAFSEETQQKTVCQEAFSYSIQQYGETEAQPEMASTFQHSYVDVTHQEQAFREGSLSYMNNGSNEVTWQQGRSSSRVSSLIKAFSSGECYRDSGTCDVILARDRYRDFGSESWDKSALLSIQRELSEFSGYHQNYKLGPYQSYRNHFYASEMATGVAQMDTTVLVKSKFKALNSTNCFFHSEFSPFQLWEEYNKFAFESTNVSGFMSANEFPRWYDSPIYKELKDNHRVPNSQCESRRFSQRQIQDVVAGQRSRSTVIQKASAIEKRCESEIASNYPPWKKNNNFVWNKLSVIRPATVSPTNEKTCRPDSNLFSNNKGTHEILVENTLPNSVMPFNISQLLTPVIHTRQETETSEILQFAHAPSVSDYSSQGEADPKLQTDVKHLRDSYKSKASSLLFNLKDNRKRVKSTYSPTRFKGLEITDRNKQTSKLEGRESRFSDILVSQETAQEILTGTDTRASCNLNREPSAATITLKDYTDGFVSYDNSTLTSPQMQDGVGNYKSVHGSSEGHSSSRDPLANVELSTHNLSAQDKSSLTSEGQLQDLNCTFSPTRPKIANMLQKAYPPTHSLPAQSQNDVQQRKDYGRKTFIDYSQNETVKERCPWDKFGSVKESDSRSESGPFRGEIAALIEMDKQRKATAKQYTANDSFRKETYMQKVNEDIKLGRLSKEEALREDTISPRKTSYSDKYGGLQSFNVKNYLVKEAPEQNVPSNSIENQNAFDHEGQKTEELYSYQPYKYEPNKQWHMATTREDRHTKESLWMQKQSETTEQTDANSNKISNASSNTEFSSNNGAPNPELQNKDSVLLTDTSDQSNITKQEDRFNINDILAIRDNEQARKLKDHPFITPKSENSQNEVKFDAAEKLTTAEPVKKQEQQGHKVQDSISPSPDYIGKDTNISNDRKDRIMSKDTDKVTTRAFSHKERGQSKQEILTSKLKAHAQKEISAIKEKGLAKQGILVRNTTKSSVTINNDGQEGHPVKKEITADKLNHLFQDITYSSVTQYKELYKTHNDPLENGSSPSTEKQPLHFEDNQNGAFEKRDERVKYIPLAVQRQNHPADGNALMKETFSHQRGTTVSDMRNNARKDYKPSRISEDKQVSVTSSGDINTNKESGKQSQELLSGHLTAAVKTEKCTCQNPPALHEEKQTFQHDQKERSSQINYTCSEKATTTPADTTKKDFTEASKSNSGLNKDSLLGLEINAPRVEEVNVHHKSKIDAAVEQPKNEPIKNRSGITASQLTTSSSDMKFKNGSPPAKPPMEPAKSKLTSNLQPVTLSADAEQLINRTYISSDSEASLMEVTARVNSIPTNNPASQRTREPETLKCINNENEQTLMIKSNVLGNQQNNTSPEKAVETNTANQMMDSRSKLGTSKETLTQKTSANDKETHKQNENTNSLLSFDKNKLSRSQNLSRINDGSKQGEKMAESVRPKQKEPPRSLEISQENNNHKSTKESQEINLSNSEPQKAEDKLEPIVSSQSKVIVDEGATQKDNTQPVSTQNVESTTDASNISLTPSKEEPMIYKICVSSKTEAASDNEPMIFSICVSSKCHIDEPQNSVKQKEESSVGTERCLKDKGFRIENDRAENEHEVVRRQTEASSNVEEKEAKIGKCEPPATMDKSNVMGRITTSYEDLLAKYGLPVSDHHGHFTSKHTQEERERKQKEETIKHGINKPLSSKEKTSKNAQTCLDDSRQASSQEASIISQPLKEAESKIKQLQHRDVPSITNHSTSDATVIAKDVEPDRNTQTIEPSMQSRVRDIQSKEKKVEEQVRNSESVQSLRKTGSIIDDVSNYTKSAKKTENVSLTTKQSAIGESTRATITDVLKTPISNTSMAKDVANTKLSESKIPRKIIPQPEKKLEEVEGKNKMFNYTDTSMPHVNKIHGRDTFNSEVQKSIHEAKHQDSTMALKQESVSHKDAQTLQKNGRGDLKAKRSQEKLQVEPNRSHEITNRMKMASKDGAATHVNNYKDKASRIGEDVCAVVKQDQAPFEAPKIHLEDIKVSTEEVSSNKEFMVGHKNQHEVIKRENLQGKKGAVVTEHVGEKDFTQQKNLPIKTLTAQNEPKTVDRMKGLGEMASKPLKRDCPSESKKTEINPREEAVQTQEKKVGDNKQPALNGDKRKKEDPVLSQNGQKDGDSQVNENRSSLGGKKKGHVEATETKKADQPNANQYHLGRNFVPETEGSVSSEQEQAQLSQKDSKKEHVLSKSEATQSNKKVTRPEISAIADYARLKVIAAEDDVKELDIFPKMDFYNNFAQSALKISKDSHGNTSGGESKREAISKEKHSPSMSIAEPKPVSLVASGSQDGAASTQPRTPANHKESNTKQTLEHPKRESYKKNPHLVDTVPLQAEGTINRSRQKITAKTNFSHSGRQESLANFPLSGNVKPAGNQINMTSQPGEEMEELQYYTVNALDIEPKPNNTPEPPSVCLKMTQNKSEEEKKEDSLSLMDYGTVQPTRPQSNSSSPAMGKPTMFRVKDNTMRPSSVTKTVKPRFHRSFSDDFRIGSPKEHLSGSEKDDETHSHEPAIATQTLQKVKETLHNNLSSAEYATKQSKSYQRRSQHFEEEETCSVISTMSEDMENCTVRPTGLADISMAFMHRNESYRDSYQRPASACYERPESVCYERPESACSDIRSFGKPPTVPPKSEKALRRAQRLTTRRLKKTETPKIAPENQEQPESKSIRNVSSVPSSPSDILPTHQAVQASPPLSQYDIQPNYTPPAHSVLAQPFPVTQRKLLQDPNSGQYFMVDVPLPVKTKTFYDPETGKYVQLNVRQRSQGAVTQPASVEMLNAPCMLYRGFLPMAASSLSPLRSSSEMSTPPALTVHQDTLEMGNESWRQNVHHRDPQQYPEILYGSHEQIRNPTLYAENSVSDNERHRDIITMSELEDFAMEST